MPKGKTKGTVHKLSMKKYEDYLNELGQTLSSSMYILDHKYRYKYFPDRYGTALRRFEPTAFRVGYRIWVRENS